MVSYLAASPADYEALVALLGDNSALMVGKITSLGQADRAEVALADHNLRADQLSAGLIAVVVLQAATRGAALDFLAAYQARFGGMAPVLLDLADLAPSAQPLALAQQITARLLERQREQAQRNVVLMRDLAAMRQAQAQLQDSFSRLEDYAYRHGLNARQQSLVLDPASEGQSLALEAGQSLIQRLPQSSEGLCDVALYLPQIPNDPGLLQVELVTAGDGQSRAMWQILLAGRDPGWLRLSLPAGLEAGAQTARLRLSWSGLVPLPLALGLRHPDPRFQLRGESDMGAEIQIEPASAAGRVLAMKLWSYVPGCVAPAVSEGIFPGATLVRRLAISGDLLSSAVNLRPENQPFLYLADSEAMLLHVNPTGPSVAILPAAVPEGVTQVSAQIMTRAEGGPLVEYAFALAPVGAPDRLEPRQPVPDFAPHLISEWQRLPAMTAGELHLPLLSALTEPHDIYLMTRLPQGVEDAAWGWATFANLRLVL